MRLRSSVAVFACLMLFGMSAAGAQTVEAIDGEQVIVPILSAGTIVLDGDLGDWATLPAIVTNTGPTPSTDPATTGQMRWQVAASEQILYVAATITDDNIIAGRNGDNYWNEDSIEVYLNFGDPAATAYGDGIAQITVSAVDRGNTDPSALSLSGLGAPGFDTSGFVFATTAGWGFEIAVDLDGIAQIADGAQFGLQMQANGSSGGDRDLKISWSNADVSDTSFQDPSVFGRGVFVADSGADSAGVVDAGSDEPAVDAASDDADSASEPGAVDAATETVSEVVESSEGVTNSEPEAGRSLLIAAIVSAVSILLGGLWFERRRKRSEANLAAIGAGAEAPNSESVQVPGDDDDEFDAMISSILDD